MPMRIRRLLTDDDAASSVIAVTFIIATATVLVVALGALAGSYFVMGGSQSPSSVQPNTHIVFDYNTTAGEPHALRISVTDGDALRPSNLYLRGTIDGTTYYLAWSGDGIFEEFDPSGSPAYTIAGTGNFSASSEEISPVQGIRLEANNRPLDAYDMTVVWETDDDSATLAADSGSAR